MDEEDKAIKIAEITTNILMTVAIIFLTFIIAMTSLKEIPSIIFPVALTVVFYILAITWVLLDLFKKLKKKKKR